MSKTAATVQQEFIRQGKSVAQWARENNFPVGAVRAVIYGHNKGNYGQSHLIAVALGLKDSPQ
ncbi:MAG: DNA-binding protein [Alphaproteobacteria bacterium HGW-Alphaproteobacteria-4]|nr:MAG: DNA-binding protein [Alphaproteobacteria bacterium HGW-Alphaproteobacteria-4]